jgi:hypothetical protein
MKAAIGSSREHKGKQTTPAGAEGRRVWTAQHWAGALHCTGRVHCTALGGCTALHWAGALHCTGRVHCTALGCAAASRQVTTRQCCPGRQAAHLGVSLAAPDHITLHYHHLGPPRDGSSDGVHIAEVSPSDAQAGGLQHTCSALVTSRCDGTWCLQVACWLAEGVLGCLQGGAGIVTCWVGSLVCVHAPCFDNT